jgi:hypothetical protein
MPLRSVLTTRLRLVKVLDEMRLPALIPYRRPTAAVTPTPLFQPSPPFTPPPPARFHPCHPLSTPQTPHYCLAVWNTPVGALVAAGTVSLFAVYHNKLINGTIVLLASESLGLNRFEQITTRSEGKPLFIHRLTLSLLTPAVNTSSLRAVLRGVRSVGNTSSPTSPPNSKIWI